MQPTALSFLHTDAFIPDANVLPNLSLGHSLDALVEIGESFSPKKKIRLFAGYAGWSAGQLEDEMKCKPWLTYPASLELVFDTPAELLWERSSGARAAGATSCCPRCRRICRGIDPGPAAGLTGTVCRRRRRGCRHCAQLLFSG